MSKEKQSQICVKHLIEKKTLFVPRHIAIFNGFSLCPACFNEVIKRQEEALRQQEAEYRKMQSHLAAEPNGEEAAMLGKIETDGTAALVEEMNNVSEESARLALEQTPEPAATVPQVQPVAAKPE